MKNLRNEKGITLVALVVTIIVLLILAGVSLSLVAGGDGIIEKASTSVTASNIATAKDAVNLKASELITEYYGIKYTGDSGEIDGYSNAGAYVAAKLPSTYAGYTATVSGTTITMTNQKDSSDTFTGTILNNGGIDW